MKISWNKIINCLFIFAFLLSFAQSVIARDYTGFDLVWSEEFDGDKLNEDVWMYDAGTGVWNTEANAELQHYTDRVDNVYVADGDLHLRAVRENYFDAHGFTSGRIKTQGRVNFMYGWVEARVKLPNTIGGLWPAFWMMGDEGIGWPMKGEIDIVEGGKKIYSDAQVAYAVPSAVHFWNEDQEAWNFMFHESGEAGLQTTLWDDYHKFQLYWDDTKLQFYMNDQPTPYYEILFADHPNLADEFQGTGFHFLINLAVGGDFTGHYTPAEVYASLPAEMLVDYIRVYQPTGTNNVYLAEEHEKSGTFGVFTETTMVSDSIDFSVSGNDIFNWENQLNDGTQSPAEGSESLSYVAQPGMWGGVGIHTNGLLNMSRYKNGHLHFKFKTNSPDQISIGIESTGADKTIWDEPGMKIVFEDGVPNPYGLERDGQWHNVVIPLDAFNNIDFHSIKLPFSFSTGAATGAWTYEVDDIYWTESVATPSPENGDYGIYSETGNFVDTFEANGGNILIWGNTLNEITGTTPSEGSESLAYVGNQGWFGMAFTPSQRHNLSAFLDNGSLKFDMKVPPSNTREFKVGLKTGTVDDAGDRYVIFRNDNSPYGFVRNNTWQTVEVPLANLDLDYHDLEQVSHLFVFFGAKGSVGQVEFDNIYYSGGGSLPSNCDMIATQLQNGDVQYRVSGCESGQTATLDVQINGNLVLNAFPVSESGSGTFSFDHAATNYEANDSVQARYTLSTEGNVPATGWKTLTYAGSGTPIQVLSTLIEETSTYDVHYSVTVNQSIPIVELNVDKDGSPFITAQPPVETDNGNGTYTYDFTHAASNYTKDDVLAAHFFLSHPENGNTYAPGPTASNSVTLTYVGEPTTPVLWTVTVEELSNGDMKYSVSTDLQLMHELLFVKKNGIHILASVQPAETNNGDGTFTYSYTHTSSAYTANDIIEARYYLYEPSIGQVFSPGPTDSTWTIPYTYGADPDVTPPSVPQNLRETASSSASVTVDWDASSDAESGMSHYTVYLDGVSQGTTGGTSFEIPNLVPEVDYSVAVTATNGGGLESAASDALTVRITTPPTPDYITVEASGDVTFSITYPFQSLSAQVFSRQNGLQNIATFMTEINNGNGTYTYTYTHTGIIYSSGDLIEARFYGFDGSSQIFTPGPTDATWASITY